MPFTATPCGSILNNSTIIGTTQVLYSNSSLSASWPSQSSIDNATYQGFQLVCQNTTFQSLVSAWGIENFSLEYEASNASAGLTYANYTVDWQQQLNGSLAGIEEWWTETLPGSSNPLVLQSVSGPTRTTSDGSSIYSTAATSANWAGYEWYVSSPAGKYQLTEEWANTEVISMASPSRPPPYSNCQQSVPSGTTIDPIAAVWTGLEDTLGASDGNLIQTGYTYDAASPTGNWCALGGKTSCDYGLWWESLPSPAFMYTGTGAKPAHTAVGELVNESVTKSPALTNTWIAEIHETIPGATPKHHLWSHNVYKQWEPDIAPDIVEAPTTDVPPSPGSHIQQIADFAAAPVEFNNSVLYTSLGASKVKTLYSGGEYQVDTLSQDGPPYVLNAVQNTNEICCPQVISWLSSEYDYYYV